MSNPLWMLLPWVVFALGAGIKFWHLTAQFRKRVLGIPSRTEQVRRNLERMWEKEQQAA